jgi:spoIIIJ-associated protein
MRIVEKEGRTKNEAVKEALKELNAELRDVRVECLDEGRTGFLGLGKTRPARVRVYLENEGRPIPSAPAAARPGQTVPVRTGVTAATADAKKIVAFVQEVCEKMGAECKATIASETGDQIVILLDAKDSAYLIGHRGRTLESLQYLVNIAFNGGKEHQKKILLDIENYREKRRASLEKLARNIAQKVRRTRQPCTLEEMNPYERRIIHVTLEREKDVETVSVGPENGSMKKVRIQLKGGKRSGRGHEGNDGQDG